LGQSAGRLTNRRVLVTGGAGFIGSSLVDALLSRENEVVCYDNLSPYYSGKEGNFKIHLTNAQYKFIQADILDATALKKAAEGMNYIFHLAAQPGVRHSLLYPELVARTNVEGTVGLLEAARIAGVHSVIFASSSSVYGNPRKMPVQESESLNPISPYGASKVAGEEYCKTYSTLYGMRITALRYFTVYGPRQRPDMAVRLFLREIENNRPVTVFGDGKQTRDLTFVDDIVAGTIASAEANLGKYEVLNLGAGHRIELLELIKTLARLAGKAHSFECKFEEPKAGDVSHTHADCSKARRLIGFNPRTSLEDGLLRFIEWYRSSVVQG